MGLAVHIHMGLARTAFIHCMRCPLSIKYTCLTYCAHLNCHGSAEPSIAQLSVSMPEPKALSVAGRELQRLLAILY